MNPKTTDIDRLHDLLLRLYYEDNLLHAREVAEELARILGDPTPECIARHIHSWILICEARGNIAEAIRLQDREIARMRTQLEAGGYEPYPELRLEHIEYVLDGLHLQAARYERIGNREKAIEALAEIYRLAGIFGVVPDQDVQEMYARLSHESKLGS
jgi:hypothetical protein